MNVKTLLVTMLITLSINTYAAPNQVAISLSTTRSWLPDSLVRRYADPGATDQGHDSWSGCRRTARV